MNKMLVKAEAARRNIVPGLIKARQSELGQFMTPSSVASFMASMFPKGSRKECHLLDAGAGVGALSCAFLDRWEAGGFDFKEVKARAYEYDDALRPILTRHLKSYKGVNAEVLGGDFIENGVAELIGGAAGFTHAILNPPYKKINSNSAHRLALREVGIETVNLYSAFVALSLALMAKGGIIVAIIPRSFCNGPYYRPFRDFILERSALRKIHLFDSRSKAFKDDDVLQENVIIMLERGAKQGNVDISTSTDDSFTDLTKASHPFDRIVFPDDQERFIHVPTSTKLSEIELYPGIKCSLADLGVKVSTGPIVEFRSRDFLLDTPRKGSVPVLYPGHFGSEGIEWPKADLKKPNAIVVCEETVKSLWPIGHYCVVRRFSSKEERRRIVANVVSPTAFRGATQIGFENHFNVFHSEKQGLPEALALGLSVYLNTSAVDEHFRRSSGHTQVNATDLKAMKYPSREVLMALGEWAKKQGKLSQSLMDEKLKALTE